jgi:WD40 repeat protein
MTSAAPPSPYKGLAPFEDSELDAQLFFGRERERSLITANLMASRLTVLYGASGVGKSSLLRAGVAHQLGKTERVAVASSWSEDPVGVLESAAAEAHEGELFLILDQLEEFFVYHGPNGVTAEFASKLAELVQHSDLPLSVLLGIREESLAKLDAFKARLPNVLGNYLRLEHLDRWAARKAIVEPLRRYGELSGDRFAIEPALVEAVLDEIAAERLGDAPAPPGGIETPYLQLVMQRVWEVERASGSAVLRLETLRELGGAERIVREHLERALAALTPAQRDAAARMFDRLVTPSGAKIAHAVADLVSYAGVDEAAAHGVVARLEGERILRPVEGAKVEIFHDVLAGSISAWRREHDAMREVRRARRRSRRLAAVAAGALVALAGVSVVAVYALAQRREAREQTAIAQAAATRALEKEREATVARAQALEKAALARESQREADRNASRAERSEARAQVSLARAEQEERQASLSAAEARRQKTLAVANAGEAQRQERLATASARRATRTAEEARQQARFATARVLVARAVAVAGVDAERSIRLALRATRLEPSLPAQDALRDALAGFRLRAVLPGGGGRLQTAVFSWDSRYVVTASARGGVRLFLVEPGRQVRTFKPVPDVEVASFSPDNRTLVAGARDGRALVWDVQTGALLRTLPHREAVSAAAYTSDGELVVTAGAEGVVRVWQAASGLLLRQIDARDPVRALSLQPGGRLAIVVTQDGSSRVLDLTTGETVARLDQSGGVTVASFSPSGDVVVAGGATDAYVWDARHWELRFTLKGHTSRITSVAFAPDNLRVMTSSADTTARLWELGTGKLLNTFTGWHRDGVASGAISSRNDSYATASADGTAGLWIDAVVQQTVVLDGHAGAVSRVAFSPDGWTILTASEDGNARLWRARDPELRILVDQEERSAQAAFSPSGDLLVTATAGGTGRLFTSKGRLLKTLSLGAPATDIAFSDSGSFVTAGEDGTARMWRPDGSPRSTLVHGARIRTAVVTPDGGLVATGGDDGRVVVFGASGRVVNEFAQGAPVTAVAFGAAGTLVTGGADGSVAVWDVRSGARVHSLTPHRGAVTALSLSSRGRLATASEDATAHVYSLRTGKLVRALQGHGQGLTIALFSPDGRVLVTASRDGDVRTWSTKTWQPDLLRGRRAPETGARHVGVINEARFSPDGRWIVTAGPTAAGIWLKRTGDLLYFIRGHRSPVRSATFSADGRRMLTAGADGTMRDYRCDLCGTLTDLQKLARARLAIAERGRR